MGRGCSQNPTKILFPISGNILQTVGQGDHQFGKTGSKTTLRGLAGSSQACSATSPYWATGQHLGPNTVSHQPSRAGFSKSREISHRSICRTPACPTGPAKCKR